MKRWKAIATALLFLGCITGVATAAEHRDGREVYRQERGRDHVRARNDWDNNRAYAYRRGDGDHDRDDGYGRDRYYRPYYQYRGYYPNSGYYGSYYPYSGYYGYSPYSGYYGSYPYGYYPYGVYPRR